MIVYAWFSGSVLEDQFSMVFKDPIVYLIVLFVLAALITLALNLFRNRKLIIMTDRLMFASRFRRREIMFDSLEWMYIGKERFARTAGRFQQVIFKVKTENRWYRIRIGRYEKERELVQELTKIAKHVPNFKPRRFSLPGVRKSNEF
jgi:hypothetical protein